MATDKPSEPKIEGRCNALKKLRDGETIHRRCRNTPAIPAKLGGNGRCKHHGGFSTGPRTAEGRAQSAANPVQHGLYTKPTNPWLERLKAKYDAETQAAWDSIPTDSDLGEELRATRLKLEHLTQERMTCLAKVRAFFRTEGEHGKVTPPESPEELADLSTRATKEGLYLTKTFELMHNAMTLQNWITLEDNCRDLLRRLAATQHDISPNNSKRGNLHFTVTVKKSARQADEIEDEIPDLAEGRAEAARVEGLDPPSDPVSVSTDDTGLTGKAIIDDLKV